MVRDLANRNVSLRYGVVEAYPYTPMTLIEMLKDEYVALLILAILIWAAIHQNRD